MSEDAVGRVDVDAEVPGGWADPNGVRVDRRSFLKTSAVGAGLVAIPGLACTGRDSDPVATASATEPPSTTGAPTSSGPTTTVAPTSSGPTTTAAPPEPVPPGPPTRFDAGSQVDTWVTPWEFVQADWPGEELTLDVVEHAAPVALFGDIGAAQDAGVGQLLFSWNGISPAPTMRIRGDESLNVRVRNMLGPNDGVLLVPTGEVAPKGTSPTDFATPTPDYCRPIHTNHKHQIRTTNIHFHGSHVTPYQNTDGTHSDDIFLRIIPQDDLELRQATQDPENRALQNPVCWPLKGSEVVGQASYQYRLGSSGGARETHPPGTHWYHPHAHGSTFTQVASGMAGLIIVEGDVDDRLDEQLRDPENPASYRERPIVIQRIVGPTAVDLEETFAENGKIKPKSSAAFPAINGQSLQTVDNYMVMAPESVERWRILNAGVDGQSYIDLLVLDLEEEDDLTVVLDLATSVQTIRWIDRRAADPVTLTITVGKGGSPIEWTREQGGSEIDSGTNPSILDDLYAEMEEFQYVSTTDGAYLHHLASDGITLVNDDGDYHTRPVVAPVMLSPANRVDLLFQAPAVSGSDPKVLSLWIRQNLSGADAKLAAVGATGTKFLQRIATIISRGTPAPPPTDPGSLELPTAPGYLKPVTDDEITVREGDPDFGKEAGRPVSVNDGKRRTRRVFYSGWGGGYPAVGTNRSNELIAYNKNPLGPAKETGGVGAAESMMIDGRKFNDDPDDLGAIGHHMLLGTAEEWTVSNASMTLFPGDPSGPPTGIDPLYDMRESNVGDEPYATPDQKPTLVGGAVDHPFHIHINPCWVTGIFDWEGQPLNWNYELDAESAPGNEFFPRWHDVMRLPRMGGYVTFRSRFWDFSGEYVNHCHILQHEDNGMMQGIAVVVEPDQADYVPMEPDQVFRRPTWHECYSLDWGVGGDDATATSDRERVDAVLADLSTPVDG